LIEQMLVYRETLSSAEFRERIVELGAPEVSSLWHQQQKNPPFVLKHNLYEY
ncbi:PTS sugar transporter subunit IIA, partial [Klebsiella pneumoniae]|nr:PTS sugar transporter subunit IIA [Klebsiella pneumoniae]